jgi:hypothetical protein
MKSATVKSSTLQAAGRWDAKYHIAVAEYLTENGLDETPENVAIAMDAIRVRDTSAKATSRDLRGQAAELLNQARVLDESAELTFPLRNRL